MSLSIAQIKAKVAPKLNGVSINNIDDFYGKCREAAGNMLQRCSPLETIRSSRIEGAIYNHVYNYAIASDVMGNDGIIDIRPISDRNAYDSIQGRFPREFDIRKERDSFSVEIVNGVKTLRLSKRVGGQHAVLHTMNSLTLEGEVTATGDVENLDVDTLNYVAGSASVKFGLSGVTGTGSIRVALNSPVDMTDLEDVGSLFWWINLAAASRMTSMTLRWGSDSSNYWYKSVTSPHDRSAFESGAFTLQRADWSTASVTGTPVVTAVDFLEVVFIYSVGTAIANNRIDSFSAARGQVYEAVYYSNKFFKSSGGTYLEVPTADSDTINVAIEGENIFLYELMLVLIQEVGQKAVKEKASFFEKKLEGNAKTDGLYDIYNEKYPAQSVNRSSVYYEFGQSESSGFVDDEL